MEGPWTQTKGGKEDRLTKSLQILQRNERKGHEKRVKSIKT